MMEVNVIGYKVSVDGSIMIYDFESELYIGYFDYKVVE